MVGSSLEDDERVVAMELSEERAWSEDASDGLFKTVPQKSDREDSARFRHCVCWAR